MRSDISENLVLLPYECNLHFVGRDEELKKLHDWLNHGENVKTVNPVGGKVAVTGPAGIGKTRLASEYAFRFGRFYTGGVYWVNAASSENFRSDLAALAIPMGLNLPVNLPDQVCAEHVLALLCQPEPSLLILDNVEDPGVLMQCAVEGGGCRMVITTQCTDLHQAAQLPIGALDKEAALALLLSRRPDLRLPALSAEQAVAEKICARLGYLPLSLELAAFYLGWRDRMSLEDYLTAWETVAAQAHTIRLDIGRKKSYHDYKQSMAVSVHVNFRELTHVPGAEPLFFAACQFAPESINPNLLGKVANLDPTTPENAAALELLHDLRLCKPAENGRLQLHRLLAQFGQKLTSKKAAATLRERVIVALLEFMKTTNAAARLDVITPELPHVIRAAEIAVSQKVWPWDFELCNQIGKYFKDRGDGAACLLWWQRAQQICQAHQPLAEELLITTLNNVGYVLQAQGDWAGALAQYGQALAIRKKMLGGEHTEVAASLDNVGEVLQAQGKRTEALALYQQALTIRKKLLGEEHPEVAVNLMKLGNLWRARGDFAVAVTRYEQALAIWQKVYGEEHPYVVTCLDNLGSVLEAQGDWVEGLAHYEQALTIRKKVLGEEHPDVASSLNNIGLVLHAQKDWTGAIAYLRRALAILEKHFDLEHFETLTVRENLAMVERAKARASERGSGGKGKERSMAKLFWVK